MKNASSFEFLKQCIEYYNNSVEVIKKLSKINMTDIKEKTYISNNFFIIEFETPFIIPSISSHSAQLIGENYLFKFEIKNPLTNERLEPIFFLKKITEIQLQNHQRERVEKNNSLNSCKVKIFFSLKNDENEIIED